jgi:hypothetical protein
MSPAKPITMTKSSKQGPVTLRYFCKINGRVQNSTDCIHLPSGQFVWWPSLLVCPAHGPSLRVHIGGPKKIYNSLEDKPQILCVINFFDYWCFGCIFFLCFPLLSVIRNVICSAFQLEFWIVSYIEYIVLLPTCVQQCFFLIVQPAEEIFWMVFHVANFLSVALTDLFRNFHLHRGVWIVFYSHMFCGCPHQVCSGMSSVQVSTRSGSFLDCLLCCIFSSVGPYNMCSGMSSA